MCSTVEVVQEWDSKEHHLLMSLLLHPIRLHLQKFKGKVTKDFKAILWWSSGLAHSLLGPNSIPGPGIKIQQAPSNDQKKNK